MSQPKDQEQSKRISYRVTEIIKPLYEDELNAIPRSILEVAGERGTVKHRRNEVAVRSNFNNIIPNSIEHLTQQGFEAIGVDYSKGRLEVEVKDDFGHIIITGHPDFISDQEVIDYKFTNDNRPETALQLAGYNFISGGKLSNKLFVFHYPGNKGLFIYEVPNITIKILDNFFMDLINNHQEIIDSPITKLNFQCEWSRIKEEYELFVPVATILPELTINSIEEAEEACYILDVTSKLLKKEKHLKSELLRFMQENGYEKLETMTKNITIVNRKVDKYDDPKLVKKLVREIKDEHLTGKDITSYIKQTTRK